MELREELLRGIYAYGFEKPSAIQQVSPLPSRRVREGEKERYQTEAMILCPVVDAVACFFFCFFVRALIVEIRTRTTLWDRTPRVASELQRSFSFETALGWTGVWSWSSSELGEGPAVLKPLHVLKLASRRPARLCVRTAFVSGVLRVIFLFSNEMISEYVTAWSTCAVRKKRGGAGTRQAGLSSVSPQASTVLLTVASFHQSPCTYRPA